MQGHAALDAPVDRGRFVERKIMAGLRAEQEEDLFQRGFRFGARNDVDRAASDQVLGVGHQLRRHFGRREFVVDQSRCDGAARHAVEFGGLRSLHDDHAVLFLDGAHAEGSVAARSREDDADGALPLVLGERTEKIVDGQTLPPRGRDFEQLQRTVEQGHVMAGRDDVGTVRPDDHAVRHLVHRHARVALDELGEDAFVVRGEVLDDDKGHTRIAVRGHARKEGFERSQSAGRGTDPDNGESGRFVRVSGRDGRLLAPRLGAAVFQAASVSCPLGRITRGIIPTCGWRHRTKDGAVHLQSTRRRRVGSCVACGNRLRRWARAPFGGGLDPAADPPTHVSPPFSRAAWRALCARRMSSSGPLCSSGTATATPTETRWV